MKSDSKLVALQPRIDEDGLLRCNGRLRYADILAPDKYKNNLISVLVYRASNICSSYQNFHNEIVRIKEILVKNSFPRALIDRIIESFLDKRFAPRPPAPQEAKTALLFCMPYLGRYSLQIKTKICRMIKQCYPGIQLNVIFRSPKRIQSFFPFKDRFPTLIRSSVVYKFQCPGCHASYFGTLQRAFGNKQSRSQNKSKSFRHRGPYQPIRSCRVVGRFLSVGQS